MGVGVYEWMTTGEMDMDSEKYQCSFCGCDDTSKMEDVLLLGYPKSYYRIECQVCNYMGPEAETEELAWENMITQA